eukprot:scaffold26346_cov20-Tisochrysis_lutea.AAC.5
MTAAARGSLPHLRTIVVAHGDLAPCVPTHDGPQEPAIHRAALHAACARSQGCAPSPRLPCADRATGGALLCIWVAAWPLWAPPIQEEQVSFLLMPFPRVGRARIVFPASGASGSVHTAGGIIPEETGRVLLFQVVKKAQRQRRGKLTWLTAAARLDKLKELLNNCKRDPATRCNSSVRQRFSGRGDEDCILCTSQCDVHVLFICPAGARPVPGLQPLRTGGRARAVPRRCFRARA